MTEDWQPPRCIHGYIILGCPEGDCPTQSAFLDQQNAAIDNYYRQQWRAAREFMRSRLGLA